MMRSYVCISQKIMTDVNNTGYYKSKENIEFIGKIPICIII